MPWIILISQRYNRTYSVIRAISSNLQNICYFVEFLRPKPEPESSISGALAISTSGRWPNPKTIVVDQRMDEPPAFEPQDAVGKAVSATMVMGLAGFTVSAIQNALTKQNVGAWGVFSRSGRIITLFGKYSCFNGWQHSSCHCNFSLCIQLF